MAGLDRPLVAALAGTFVLRCASWAAGFIIGLYLGGLDRSGSEVPAILVGVVAVSFYLSELLGGPVMGWLSDRMGRYTFMLLGPLLGGVAIQLLGLATAVPVLLLVRMMEGLSTASSVPATLGYLSARTATSPALRGRVMAFFEVATVVGLASGSLVAGLLWDHLGVWAFTAVAGIYAVSLGLFAMANDEAARVRHRAEGHVVVRLLRRDLLSFAPAWLAVNSVLGVWFAHGAFQLSGGAEAGQRLVGAFTGTQIGLAFAAFGVLFSVGAVVWGFAMGRLGTRRVMAIGIGGVFVAVAGLLLLNHSEAPAPHVLGLVLLVAGIFLESGFTPAALAYLAALAEVRAADRGAVMGLYTVLLGIGQLTGGALGGVFAEALALDGLILLTALLGVAAGVSLKALAGETRPAPAPTRAFEIAPDM